MLNRSEFIKLAGIGGLSFPWGLGSLANQSDIKIRPEFPQGTPADVKNEEYWLKVAHSFVQNHPYTQLENGYFSPMPEYTRQYFEQQAEMINQRTSWFMRKEQSAALESARASLAGFLQTDAEQVALTRNTTESLNTVIQGFHWKKGDEAIIGDQDYGSMVASFRQIEKRHGVVIRVAKIPLHPQSDEEVAEAYLKHVNNKTRMLHLTHLINLSGQIIPVKMIAEKAGEKGITVVVDSAHALAQIQFDINDLGADFVGASLHKWLSAPLGLGLLWAKKSRIKDIWPLMADDEYPEDNIRKFEHLGTRPLQAHMGIDRAIVYHKHIGAALKEARLRHLKESWHAPLQEVEKLIHFTPEGERSCALACVGLRGYSPNELAQLLFERYRIFTVAINHPVIRGVRVTPHLFNSRRDVLLLKDALLELAS
jgi:selenocysteine lyase/cysteine desulfurase